MTFPTPFTVGWHHATESGEDGYGDPNIVYTPPLEDDNGQPVTGAPVRVHTWAPPGARGMPEPDPGRVIHDLDLFVPPGTACSPSDVVEVPGMGRFEVVGWPLDYTTSPFAPGLGGLVVELKRITR